MADELRFPVGSFVRRRDWRHDQEPTPVGPHDVYEVLTNPFMDTYGVTDRGPFIMGRRTSTVVYPNRVDRLEYSRMVAVTKEELVASLTNAYRFIGKTDRELVEELVG